MASAPISAKITQVGSTLVASWEVATSTGLGSQWVYVRPKGTLAWGAPVVVPPNDRTYTLSAPVRGVKYEVKIETFNYVGSTTVVGELPVIIKIEPPVEPPPVEEPKPTGNFWFGVCGLSDHGQTQAKIAVSATHAGHDRIDVSGTLNNRVKEETAAGRPPLVLMDNLDTGSVKKISEEMHTLGLTRAEFGNEIYYHNGYSPYGYAAEYKAAHAITSSYGIKLGANLYGDGTSGSVEQGKGWGKAFSETAGFLPDFWTYHPYGGIAEDHVGETKGWLTTLRMLELMKSQGWQAPLWVTEVGFPVWKGSDGRAAVTEVQQAEYVMTMIADSAKWQALGLEAFFWFGCQDSTASGGSSEGGYGLYDYQLKARLSATAYGTAITAL